MIANWISPFHGSDTRAGTEASSKQDLARAVVAFDPASRWRGPLRTAGLGCVVVALVALAAAVANRRDARPAAGVNGGIRGRPRPWPR